MLNHDNEEFTSRLGNKTRWALVDLDGCLAESVWETSNGIGAPIIKNCEKLVPLVKKGFKIKIWTARPWTDVENIERWCKKYLRRYGVKIRSQDILCGKPFGVLYIDDKAINSEKEEWTL